MAQTLDLADFGFKDISTTGSMATGSNQLTIAAGAGFRVGDSVIVEIGGEAGHGLRGTMGVGGVDPAVDQSYYKGADAPKALTAKIVGISADGTVLTLDHSAVTATSKARENSNGCQQYVRPTTVAPPSGDGYSPTTPLK